MREVWLSRLVRNCRGAVATEYLLLVTLIGVPLAVLMMALAPRLSAHHADDRALLSRPVP